MRKGTGVVAVAGIGLALGLATGCDLLQGLQPATLIETGGGGQGGSGGTGASGATTSAGGTTATSCEPGTSIDCYTGPEGTEGVAMCKGGKRACKVDGSGYEDVCEGEVLPQPETCASTGDEDCDKLDCVRWASVYGDSNEQLPLDIAADSQGAAYVVGAFGGALPLVEPPLVSAGEHDLFLARVNPDGTVAWARRFGDAADQDSARITVDSGGNVILAGVFQGTMSFGGADLVAQGFDAYVAKFDGSGAHLWSKRFGDMDVQRIDAVRVDANGNVLLAGAFRGSLDLGKGAMSATCCDFDVFAAKLAPDGSAIWSKSFGDADAQDLTSASLDSSGSLIVSGGFSGNLNFGGGDLVATSNEDAYVARLDGSGGYDWSKKYTGDTLLLGPSTSDSSANIALFGSFAGTTNFGGGDVTSDGSGLDLFLTKMTVTGFFQWAKPLPTTGSSNFASGLVADADGNLVATAWGLGTVDFGGGMLGMSNYYSVFLAKLSGDGEHMWSRRFPGSQSVVATAPNGDILLAAQVSGTIDVGTGPIVTKGQDLLIARFAP